ncbi:protein-L-isoaspartate O-methyltransferase family protein [Actinopolymorpha pittospori]
MLLEQSDVWPGQRVLEIGTGIDYNAAVLSHLVGPDGQVTTIEYDAEIAERARETLEATGHENVRVVHGDGALGHPEGAPYDRVIVSTGSWDVPPAWLGQLTPVARVGPVHARRTSPRPPAATSQESVAATPVGEFQQRLGGFGVWNVGEFQQHRRGRGSTTKALLTHRRNGRHHDHEPPVPCCQSSRRSGSSGRWSAGGRQPRQATASANPVAAASSSVTRSRRPGSSPSSASPRRSTRATSVAPTPWCR